MDASSHLAKYYCCLVCMTNLMELCRQTLRCTALAPGGPAGLEEHAWTRSSEMLSALCGNTVISCDSLFFVMEFNVLK